MGQQPRHDDQLEDRLNRLVELEYSNPPPVAELQTRIKHRTHQRVGGAIAALLMIAGGTALVATQDKVAQTERASTQNQPKTSLTPEEEVDQLLADWGTGTCPTPPPRPEHPTEEWRARFHAMADRTDEITEELGWAPRQAQSMEDGAWVCGWTPVVEFDVDAAAEAAADDYWHETLFDRPDGNVIGYMYGPVGFLSRATAEAGTFDLEAEMIEVNGCASVFPSGCRGDEPEP
jgi:hypothetical protein